MELEYMIDLMGEHYNLRAGPVWLLFCLEEYRLTVEHSCTEGLGQAPRRQFRTTSFSTLSECSVNEEGIYPFSQFCFTNCDMQGSTGPDLATLLAAYDQEDHAWLADPMCFNVLNDGIQTWTVPITGKYKVDLYGAGNPLGTVFV